VVDLVPGINLIVGTSDVGKSAFMRAMNLVMHNEIPNREFVTFGEQDATVVLEFSDGTIVERVKGKTKNAYYATLPDGTVIEKEKLGNNSAVPEEIYKALGSPPVDKKHGPLAYADQHSPLFLVSLTPTELPRSISELTGLDDYETASMELSKNARRFDRKIKEGKERIVTTEAELEKYQSLDSELELYEAIQSLVESAESLRVETENAENTLREYNSVLEQGRQILSEINDVSKIIVLQQDYEKVQELEEEIENISSTMSDYNSVIQQINQLDIDIYAASEILVLQPDYERFNTLESEIESLNDMVSDYVSINEQIENLQSDITKTNLVLDEDFVKSIEHCNKLYEFIKSASETMDEYNQIIADGTQTKSEIDETQKLIEELEMNKEKMIEEFANAGLLCPECKQPVGANS
jgi:DNA repair exonuclease SbcCD ATPase subunit